MKIEALANLSFVKGGTMEGSDMNVSEKMDMVSTDMGMKSTDMGIMSTDMGMMSTDMGMMSTDMGMVMSGHQHGAHYRGMDGPGDESGKFILAVQILLPNMSPSQSD